MLTFFVTSFVQDTRFNFAWDDCIPGEIANNAYSVIWFFLEGGLGGKQYVFSADCRPLSGCFLLFPRKLMWTDSTVKRFFILLVYYLFHFSLTEWIQLTGKHMADEALGKSNIHEEYLCRAEKRKL